MRNCASGNDGGAAQPNLLRRFQAKRALLMRWEWRRGTRIVLVLRSGRKQSMRWKTNHREHDPRHVDLMAVLALLILIVAAYRFYTVTPNVSATTAFIEPSQTVRW
jgi:hypothetical protein